MSNALRELRSLLSQLEKKNNEENTTLEKLKEILLNADLNKELRNHKSLRKQFSSILDCTLNNIAANITDLSRQLFVSIPRKEFYLAFGPALKLTPDFWPKFQRYYQFGQDYSRHIENKLYLAQSDEERAIEIEFILLLAKKFYDARNYHNLMSIHSGLRSRNSDRFTRHGLSSHALAINNLLSDFTTYFTGEKMTATGEKMIINKFETAVVREGWRIIQTQEEKRETPSVPYLGQYDTIVDQALKGDYFIACILNAPVAELKTSDAWNDLSIEDQNFYDKLSRLPLVEKEFAARQNNQFAQRTIAPILRMQEENISLVLKQPQKTYDFKNPVEELKEFFEATGKKNEAALDSSFVKKKDFFDPGIEKRFIDSTESLTYDDLCFWLLSYHHEGKKPGFKDEADFPTPANALLDKILTSFPLTVFTTTKPSVSAGTQPLTNRGNVQISQQEVTSSRRATTENVLSIDDINIQRGKGKEIDEMEVIGFDDQITTGVTTRVHFTEKVVTSPRRATTENVLWIDNIKIEIDDEKLRDASRFDDQAGVISNEDLSLSFTPLPLNQISSKVEEDIESTSNTIVRSGSKSRIVMPKLKLSPRTLNTNSEYTLQHDSALPVINSAENAIKVAEGMEIRSADVLVDTANQKQDMKPQTHSSAPTSTSSTPLVERRLLQNNRLKSEKVLSVQNEIGNNLLSPRSNLARQINEALKLHEKNMSSSSDSGGVSRGGSVSTLTQQFEKLAKRNSQSATPKPTSTRKVISQLTLRIPAEMLSKKSHSDKAIASPKFADVEVLSLPRTGDLTSECLSNESDSTYGDFSPRSRTDEEGFSSPQSRSGTLNVDEIFEMQDESKETFKLKTLHLGATQKLSNVSQHENTPRGHGELSRDKRTAKKLHETNTSEHEIAHRVGTFSKLAKIGTSLFKRDGSKDDAKESLSRSEPPSPPSTHRPRTRSLFNGSSARDESHGDKETSRPSLSKAFSIKRLLN